MGSGYELIAQRVIEKASRDVEVKPPGPDRLLSAAIGHTLDAFTSEECANYLKIQAIELSAITL